jgi:hypothetical protein
MSEQNILAPAPGGRVTPGRFIPPLPPGIPILPGQVRAAGGKRRLPAGLIILLIIVGLAALEWLKVWYSDYDTNRIDPVVTQAMFAHAPKGTRIPVTLWGGPRILQIDFASVGYPAGSAPYTCVTVLVLDPRTGLTVSDPKYRLGNITCIEGLAYPIR